jgi:hypothetical protein
VAHGLEGDPQRLANVWFVVNNEDVHGASTAMAATQKPTRRASRMLNLPSSA